LLDLVRLELKSRPDRQLNAVKAQLADEFAQFVDV